MYVRDTDWELRHQYPLITLFGEGRPPLYLTFHHPTCMQHSSIVSSWMILYHFGPEKAHPPPLPLSLHGYSFL